MTTRDEAKLPKIHPRETIVVDAENELSCACHEITGNLTTSEKLRVLASVLSSQVGHIAKFCIRAERHGDTNQPGGLD